MQLLLQMDLKTVLFYQLSMFDSFNEVEIRALLKEDGKTVSGMNLSVISTSLLIHYWK